jgi:hypothetical protein
MDGVCPCPSVASVRSGRSLWSRSIRTLSKKASTYSFKGFSVANPSEETTSMRLTQSHHVLRPLGDNGPLRLKKSSVRKGVVKRLFGFGKAAIKDEVENEEKGEGLKVNPFNSTRRQYHESQESILLPHTQTPWASTTLIAPRSREEDVVSRTSRYRPQRIPLGVPYQNHSPTGTRDGGNHSFSLSPTVTNSSQALSSEWRSQSQMQDAQNTLPTPPLYRRFLSPV